MTTPIRILASTDLSVSREEMPHRQVERIGWVVAVQLAVVVLWSGKA